MSNDEGNIIDFKSRRASKTGQAKPDPEQIAADSLRLTRDRLAHADILTEQLRKNLRIGKEDRPRLARNLGRMLESAGSQRLSGLIGEVFRMAFPRGDAAESALKKRKRYVRLKDELLPTSFGQGEYNAHGAVYVSLAEAFAKVVQDSSLSAEDNRRRAILNLIEGTSWDDRRSASTRRAQAGQQEFAERMDDVLRRVVAAADLDVLFDAAADLPLTATRGREADDWSDLRLGTEIWPLDVENSQEIENFHFLAPRVLLGMLYMQRTVPSHIPVSLPQDVSVFTPPEALREVVETALLDQYETDLLDATRADPEDSERWHAAWEKCAVNEIEPIQLGWEGFPVLLSVQRERSSGRPCLCITSTAWDYDYEVDFRIYLELPGKSHGGHVRIGSRAEFVYQGQGRGSLVYENEFNFPLIHEWTNRVLLVPNVSTTDLLFMPLHSISDSHNPSTDSVCFQPHFRDCPDRFSPAPHRSIAGAILRNLAHGPEGSRIDELLIANARKKVGQVVALQKQLEQSYMEKISRLHSDPPRNS